LLSLTIAADSGGSVVAIAGYPGLRRLDARESGKDAENEALLCQMIRSGYNALRAFSSLKEGTEWAGLTRPIDDT